jgi:hypothetical protein
MFAPGCVQRGRLVLGCLQINVGMYVARTDSQPTEKDVAADNQLTGVK